MDTNLSDLLIEVCKEYGCDESFALPSIKILHENFFFKLKDIKNLNFDLWRSLNLPVNLFFILQSKISLCEGNLGVNPFQQQSSQIKPTITQFEKKPEIDIKTNLNQQYPIPTTIQSNVQPLSSQVTLNAKPISTQDDTLKNELFQNLDKLVAEINDRDKAGEVLRKIHTIIMNIIENPDNIKFRKLKFDSNFFKNYVKPYLNAAKFLELLHFALTTDGQYLEFMADHKFISKAGELMNDFLIERRFAELNFNPYKTSITSISGFDPNKVKIEKTDFDELIKKEFQRRDEIVKNSKGIEREPKVFHIASNESMGEVIQTLNEEDKFDQRKIEEDDFYKYAMSIIKGNTDKFVVKRRSEFEKLVNKPIYTKATIRVKFPNELLIQGNFAMMETIGDVYNFVRDNLIDPNLTFVLFTSFPSKKYTDLKATIYSQSLAPSTLLYVSFPGIDPQKNPEYKYLNQNAIEKYSSDFKTK